MINEWTPEAWASYCRANTARRMKEERDRQCVSEMLDHSPGSRLLEAGCGYGRLTPLLTEASHLIVLDREIRMVRTVRRAIAKRLLSGVVSDVEHLPFPEGSFDTVLCIGVLMHVARPLHAIDELARLVRPGGRLLISWNNFWSPWAIPLGFWALRPGALRQRFIRSLSVHRILESRGFSLESIRGDSLLPLAAAFPGTDRTLWPLWLLRWLKRLDEKRWGRWLLARQGYELFAAAKRKDR